MNKRKDFYIWKSLSFHKGRNNRYISYLTYNEENFVVILDDQYTESIQPGFEYKCKLVKRGKCFIANYIEHISCNIVPMLDPCKVLIQCSDKRTFEYIPGHHETSKQLDYIKGQLQNMSIYDETQFWNNFGKAIKKVQNQFKKGAS